MKSITDIFIRRPVLAIVVNVVILVAGLRAITSLNTRQYPRLDSATITIRTVYIGADAELVRGFITVPLERAVAAAEGIDYIESQSTQGLSTINVRLKLNFDSTAALADISTRVAQVRADLPPEAQVPSIAVEPSEAAFAAMYLSFGSSILDQNQVTDFLIRIIQPRLAALPGVQKADILGGRTFAMRVWLMPDRMAALNVSPSAVRAALAANNYAAAVGQTKGNLTQLDISATTDISSVEEVEQLVIRQHGGTLVRLKDIANVELGAEEYDFDVRFSGKRAVFMGVWVAPTSSSLEVIRGVRAEMEKIQRELPSGMEGYIAFDSTEYIEDAMSEVVHTLADTILIVAIVIFLFIGSLRSVIVPLVAIPISLIGGVFLMYSFGFTLNLLTLLAIVLSVGLVVDDAIVVVENVERHVQEGMSRFQAALLGARELVGPIISMTITLAAVYMPARRASRSCRGR
jgi:multidrug efflux pump